MFRCRYHFLLVLILAAPVCLRAAQSAARGAEAAVAPGTGAWGWFHELSLPESKSPWVDFMLTPEVFDKARPDLGDLRLFDAGGREVPFALRVRPAVMKLQELPATEFSRARKSDDSIELCLDLGESPPDHGQIDLNCGNRDFCRRVQIDASEDRSEWTPLVKSAWISHYLAAYHAESTVTETRRVSYPLCRSRCLRVRVSPDANQPDDRPQVVSATVYHATEAAGEYVTLPAALGPSEEVATRDGPGTAWRIDLGAGSVPCDRLIFEAAPAKLVCRYSLEKIESDTQRWTIAEGEWRRSGQDGKPLEIRIEEVTARRLRLVVTGQGDPPLDLKSVQYAAPARQIIFARGDDLALPLRLCVGNPRAKPPRYDFAATLPESLAPLPARATLGEQQPSDIADPSDQGGAGGHGRALTWSLAIVGVAILLGTLGLLARRLVLRRAAAPKENRTKRNRGRKS
jgi:hypothetical protein